MTASPKINLVYNKYVSGDKTKNISKQEFYTNLQSQTQTQPLCVYLTNGTNKELDNGGNGTTAAFRELSNIPNVGDLFDVTNATIVFDSSSKEFDNKKDILSIISGDEQVWTHSNSTYKGKYAGSVIRVDANGNNKDFPVCGGYHINGIKLDNTTDAAEKNKVETNSVGLVKAYYTAIMEDFFKIATNAPSSATSTTSGKHHVLHLAQIPGHLYGGTEITGNAFHTAVKDWIASKDNVTPPLSMSMTISIDFENPVSGPTSPPVPIVPSKPPVSSSSSPLKSKIDAVAQAKKKHSLFTIANEIYTAFFETTPKTVKKEFLDEQLTKIENAIPVANKAEFQGRIDKVRTDLKTATSTAAATSAVTTPTIPPATSAAPTVTSSSPTSGGGNLNVMTFNTWHQALGNPPKQTFCMDGGSTNKCQNNIRQAILDHMKKHEQSIVFLQEFTYKFDEFFNVSGAGVTVNKDEIASTTMMAKDKDSSSSPSSSIPAFRYFTMTYKSKTFHVYIGQIGQSVIATIYSDTFHAGPADAFFVGNLAAGNLKAGSSNDSNANSYDLAYTFSGTSDKSSGVTENPPPKGGYSAFGGNRPFIVLRFDTKKCVLVNVHVPHGNDVFRDGSKGKPTGTLAEFAFNALARFIPDTVFKDKPQNEYAFILGGDFNTATPDIKKWLKEPTTSAVTRTTGTCCTTDGGLNFTKPGAVDHIFSTLPITKYSVHKIDGTEQTKSDSRYFFSDHLPVYAEIDFKAPPATSSP